MKVKVIQPHHNKWEITKFPTFAKGTVVLMNKKEDDEFPGWHPCEIDGHQTFVPQLFVCDGKLTREYNPTELVQEAGDVLEVQEIVHAWLIATNEKGTTGWITAENVVSVKNLN